MTTSTGDVLALPGFPHADFVFDDPDAPAPSDLVPAPRVHTPACGRTAAGTTALPLSGHSYGACTMCLPPQPVIDGAVDVWAATLAAAQAADDTDTRLTALEKDAGTWADRVAGGDLLLDLVPDLAAVGTQVRGLRPYPTLRRTEADVTAALTAMANTAGPDPVLVRAAGMVTTALRGLQDRLDAVIDRWPQHQIWHAALPGHDTRPHLAVFTRGTLWVLTEYTGDTPAALTAASVTTTEPLAVLPAERTREHGYRADLVAVVLPGPLVAHNRDAIGWACPQPAHLNARHVQVALHLLLGSGQHEGTEQDLREALAAAGAALAP